MVHSLILLVYFTPSHVFWLYPFQLLSVTFFKRLTIPFMQLKQIIKPKRIIHCFILSKNNIFELYIFTVNPRVGIIELYHVDAFLRGYKGRSCFILQLLSCQNLLFHLNLAIDLS